MTSSQTRQHPKNADKILSRSEVEALIAEGRHIIIVDGKVLKCDAWMPYHPGGDKAIRHMVGRDATDEVSVLHSAHTKKRMLAYAIGRIEGHWDNFVPPIQGGTFRTAEEQKIPQAEPLSASYSLSESSSAASLTGSPIFDSADDERAGLRHRYQNGVSRSSSVSSIGLEDSDPKMGHFDIRTKEEIQLDISKYPPLDPVVQDEIIRKYRLLHKRIEEEGLFQCNYWAYAIEATRYAILFTSSMVLLQYGWYKSSAILLGLFWHQLVFSAHDAGHCGITHDYHTDTVIGILISDFLGGLSLGWWKRNHNIHHIVTNSPEHDPDIQHIPFFAVSHRFLESLRSTYYDRDMTYDPVAKVLIRFQHCLYYVILLFGRFNLYRLSWEYLLGGQAPQKGPAWWHRWLELAGQLFFWAWFGYGILYQGLPDWSSRLAYLMISHMVTAPVHVQITLSHFAMSTADLGVLESFPQKMLRTTMDVDCPQWLDFIHGGLQFQAIHHLYPRIPRHNLRRTQKLVMDFCDDVHIPYAIYGFVDGNKEVVGRLKEVAIQAKIMAECQKKMMETGDLGLH